MVKGRRSTIKDVAQRAGVSTATVSFVLNDNPNETISAAVRRRVLEAARELSYHASAAAAGLARKRIGNIGLVFYAEQDAIGNHFYSFVIQGAVKEAIERGYNLLFSYVDAEYRGFQDLPKIVREKNADGVLFMRRVLPKMVKDIGKLGLPVVAVDPFPRLEGVSMVEIDDRRGGVLAAEHLLELGHQDLAMLLPRDPAPSVEQRLLGFREALERRGLRFSRERRIEASALSFEAGYAALRRVFARRGGPTAVFAANDEMAAGALRAAREAGRGVPRDVSVVGFDDIVMSNYTDPPLTTVGVDKERMGRRAMTHLIELVERVATEPTVELTPVELVVRGSTAPLSAERSASR